MFSNPSPTKRPYAKVQPSKGEETERHERLSRQTMNSPLPANANANQFGFGPLIDATRRDVFERPLGSALGRRSGRRPNQSAISNPKFSPGRTTEKKRPLLKLES